MKKKRAGERKTPAIFYYAKAVVIFYTDNGGEAHQFASTRHRLFFKLCIFLALRKANKQTNKQVHSSTKGDQAHRRLWENDQHNTTILGP